MEVRFKVSGFPPKKGTDLSMWAKSGEAEKVRKLRVAAAEAFGGRPPLARDIHLELYCYIGESNTRATGDLDNFVTGVCDGLMAAAPGTPVLPIFEEQIKPTKAIGILDDCEVVEISARKIVSKVQEPYYEVVLGGEVP